MGATTFHDVVKSDSAADAFNELRDAALYEKGHVVIPGP